MNLKRQERFFKEQLDGFYAFAVALVSNQPTARKLVLDAAEVLTVDGMDLVKNFCRSGGGAPKRRMECYLYGKIFGLAKVLREGQGGRIKMRNGAEYFDFYRLSLEQRAILYLKHKSAFSYADLEEIVNLFRHEIIAELFEAREKLVGSAAFGESGSESAEVGRPARGESSL